MNLRDLYRYNRMMQKYAASVLTPEAEQAAVQGGMDPSMAQGGAPMDPSMMGGQPPMDSAMGGESQGQGPNGGQIPPEIMQDQQFIQWLASQGVMFDPQSGMFFGPDGQPVPVEMIVQAYQMYMQQMQSQAPAPEAQGGAPMDPSMTGGQPPMDPAMAQQGMDPSMGQMPPEAQGGAPMDTSMMGGQPGGQIPPEILQDQQFMAFLEQMGGVVFDPQSGQFIATASGQPVPPDMIMQAYQMFQQQMQAQGGQPGASMDPAMAQGGAPEEQPQVGMPPEFIEAIQSTVDAAIERYTAQIDKKIETLLDKLDVVKQALESMRDTDDKRTAADKDEAADLRDQIAAELNPTIKTANATKPVNEPVNIFSLLK